LVLGKICLGFRWGLVLHGGHHRLNTHPWSIQCRQCDSSSYIVVSPLAR
jgi:hypothetical protein